MEFVGPNFKDDFPSFPTISVANNPKHVSFNLMGNPNALLQNYNAVGFQHNQGHDTIRRRADDGHRGHLGIFRTDLSYDPFSANDYSHDRRRHHGHINSGDEPMVLSGHALNIHDLNMMPGEEEGSGAALDFGEKGKGKERVVVEPQPVEEPAQEINPADTKTPIVKGQWSSGEDRDLTELVNQYGAKKWSFIAQKLGGRVGKQCRERWHNHLRSNIKKGEWSLEEDMLLIEAHKLLGTKWCQIAKYLPGRTENTIKNHWNATMRKHLPRGGSAGDGSTLLQNYIRSVTSSSKNDTTNKRKYTKKNGKADDDGKQMVADYSNMEKNLNLELAQGW